ncbi:hypothetical protein [Candidatus Pelagibacter sp. FZCC0015]|uniref:hypothetical protein n=1 Tax=Candidatus Pelagibacter sp. FZCC0015 TaxID=2268451 RepID=UPI00143D3187|nr:hypothetical protein [Candidatus Pelagibacter sp. FZCC0015]
MDFKKIKGNLIHKTAIINWKSVSIGKNNVIGPYVVIGTNAQHVSEKSFGKIKIGNNNIFREFTTVHLPTKLKKITYIANNCHFMTLSHIAHDCYIESNVVFSNNVTLGGNTHVMKSSQLGFNTIVHQNQVIGSYSMIGMGTIVTKKFKVIPGFTYAGNPVKRIKKNHVGLKRKKITSNNLKKETIRFNKIIKKHIFYE